MNPTSPGNKDKLDRKPVTKRGKLSLKRQCKGKNEQSLRSVVPKDDTLNNSMECFTTGGKHPKLPEQKKLSTVPNAKKRSKVNQKENKLTKLDQGTDSQHCLSKDGASGIGTRKNCHLCEESVLSTEMSTHLKQCFSSRFTRKKCDKTKTSGQHMLSTSRYNIVYCTNVLSLISSFVFRFENRFPKN